MALASKLPILGAKSIMEANQSNTGNNGGMVVIPNGNPQATQTEAAILADIFRPNPMLQDVEKTQASKFIHELVTKDSETLKGALRLSTDEEKAKKQPPPFIREAVARGLSQDSAVTVHSQARTIFKMHLDGLKRWTDTDEKAGLSWRTLYEQANEAKKQQGKAKATERVETEKAKLVIRKSAELGINPEQAVAKGDLAGAAKVYAEATKAFEEKTKQDAQQKARDALDGKIRKLVYGSDDPKTPKPENAVSLRDLAVSICAVLSIEQAMEFASIYGEAFAERDRQARQDAADAETRQHADAANRQAEAQRANKVANG